MGLEVATYIADLVATNPLTSDPVAQGDDHLRLLKSTVNNTFPNFGNRFSRVVTVGVGQTLASSDNTVMLDVPQASAGTLTHTISLPPVTSITSGFYVDINLRGGSDVAIIAAPGATVEGSATQTIGPRVRARAFYQGSSTWGLSILPMASVGTGGMLFGGDVTISGALTVKGAVSISSSVAISNRLSIGDACTVGSTLTVSGATVLKGALSVGGAATMQGINATGLDVTGASGFDSITVNNAASFEAGVTMKTAVTISGGATLHSTLSVSGAAHMKTTLSVGGATTLASTLTVSGATVLLDGLHADGAATFSSAVTMNSTLSVSGAVHFKSSLSVSGGATFAGTVTISGTCVLSNGQLQFPATQNPSSGANTLDDYEEGTWTPVITFATPGDLSVVYSIQAGVYQKLGRHVSIDFRVVTSTFTHTTASGAIQITGLPFSQTTLDSTFPLASYRIDLSAGFTHASGRGVSGTANVQIIQNGDGVASGFTSTANYPSGTQLDFVGTGRITAAN